MRAIDPAVLFRASAMRVAVGIEYDGTAYNGWQRQKNGCGIQSLVERALATIAGAAVELHCAGRTDSGVHASCQVAHFDTDVERSTRSWLLGANSNLPDDINVIWAQPASSDFHARYSATSRTYRYLILNRLVRSALFRHRAWWFHPPLDPERMQLAANQLLGEHDFSAFRAAGCQARSTRRNLSELSVIKTGDWLAITVTANAFLQHMVRNISGMLVAVGSGAREPAWAAELLNGRDRTAGGVTAPAHGLTLIGVDYPEQFTLPKPAVPALLPGIP